MARVRKISLNTEDINQTIKDLKQMKKEIESVPKEIEKTLNEAVEYCKKMSGNFIANTYWEKTAKGYRIVQEGEGVLYVEFGTGVKGAAQPHPAKSEFGLAEYNSGPTIRTTAGGKTGWDFPIDETMKEWRFTEGQPARQQMFLTGVWLRQRLGKEVAMRVEKAVKKW